jgi:hypothetical protein
MPRWVKVFAIIGALVAVGVVAMLLSGHDPGRHLRRSVAPATVVFE